jgi:hypothetical protein
MLRVDNPFDSEKKVLWENWVFLMFVVLYKFNTMLIFMKIKLFIVCIKLFLWLIFYYEREYCSAFLLTIISFNLILTMYCHLF